MLSLFAPTDADDESGALSKDVLLSRLTELFGEAAVKELSSDDWKVRLIES